MRTHWRNKTKQQPAVNFSQLADDFWLTHQCFTSSVLHKCFLFFESGLYFSSLGSPFSCLPLHCHSLALSALLSLLTLLQRASSSLILWGWGPGFMTKCNKSQWPRVHFHSLTQKSKQQQDNAPPQFTVRKCICTRIPQKFLLHHFSTDIQFLREWNRKKISFHQRLFKKPAHLSFSHTSIINDLWENTNQRAKFYYHYYCCSPCF